MKPPRALIMGAWFVVVACFTVFLAGASTGEGHRPSSDVLIEGHGPDFDYTCSGVYLGDGKVLTARHCIVDKAKYIVVQDEDGAMGAGVNAVSEWTSEVADVAVLRTVEKLDATPARLSCRAPVIGEEIEVVGNPLDQNFIHTWGKVAGASRPEDNGEDLDEVPIDVGIAPGNSGGPAYDSAGFVLGIVNEGAIDIDDDGLKSPGRINFMVSAQEACEKYDHHAHAMPRLLAYLAHVLGLS